ncbi:adenylosuccinate synthetase [Patiriisocius marinistellae]|uniref:adenylosuccinate synthetase n=1 Tax=Patiriisocius marinistellae TaxID=2494560 RepID=UPI00125D2D1B|nr:adenylosuccinate synthetase [Patiriisocius marinistellae]
MNYFNKILYLQVPTGTPNPGDSNQLDLSNPFDLIMFIILPICIVVFYFLWRRSVKKNK